MARIHLLEIRNFRSIRALDWAPSAGINCLNTVFLFESLRVATDSTYTAAFGVAGSNALVLLLLDIQHHGTLIAQVFFGLWLAPLGYLAYNSSGMFPKSLGVTLIIAAVGYLVDVFVAFLMPEFSPKIRTYAVVIPATVAEVSMLAYLLIVGVKTVEQTE